MPWWRGLLDVARSWLMARALTILTQAAIAIALLDRILL